MATPSRPIQSCFQCRKRKIKCNRSYPCAPCILRGEGDVCREVDKNQDSLSKTTTEIIEDLLNRVSTLEAAVSKLSDVPRASSDEPSQVPSPSGSPPAHESETSTIGSSFGQNITDEDIAMMLEPGFCHGPPSKPNSRDPGPGSRPILQPPQLEVISNGIHLGVPDGLALLIDSSTDIMGRLLVPMLPVAQTRILIQFYFDRLDWYSKVLHRPTFITESRSLMINIVSRNDGAIRIGFLAVHYMVLCLALHLIEPVIREQLELSFDAAYELARRMYSAAQACLYFDEFISSHSLEHLQCIILMGLYQQNLDESDAHWALMGTAIKIAQNLGISRLGSEGEPRQYSAAWRSVVKREVARRVWWMLIWDDWSNAAAHNGTYAIHPNQNHTGFPANINDSDLVDGQPFTTQPSHTYTEMTFSLRRLHFVELYRQIVDNQAADYGLCSKWTARYHHDFGTSLTLPWPWFGGQGLRTDTCTDYGRDTEVDSRIQCVNSATAILDYLKSEDEQSALLLKWWLVLFYGFAAAVVLFIDLCHKKPMTDLTWKFDEYNYERRWICSKHVSAVSRNAIVLLEDLLTVEPEMPSKPSRKRAATDEEPFERVVKRMIIDASRNLTVPSSHSSNGSITDLSFPSPPSPLGLTPPSISNSPPDCAVPSANGNDLFVSGALFRDEGMFSGSQFDDQTMAQIAQLLYNDPYGFLDSSGRLAEYI
ncbi:fungal-specific transcription factor domain-containing protein [Mycena leptocephala]|nr:fungal-specific transcription factor domain-containing protein [Mycena leptocephala]